MEKIVPNLWFDTEAQEAAEFYTSLFPDSRIGQVTHYTEVGPREAGTVMTVEFELAGQTFLAINGGPEFKFNEALSLEIRCSDQDEIDRYWEELTAGGGEEGQCGWLKDRYGVSWQVTPANWGEVFDGDGPEALNRVMAAMLKMRKFDLAELDRARAGA